MKRKEYQELTLEERVAKEKKKTKTVFIVVIMGILAIIGFFWLFEDAILDAMIPETPVYELSEEEKKWLKPVFIDQERIEEGRLLNYQIWEVEKGRYGLSVLKEKYPGYQFRITYLYVDSSFSNFTVKEKRTGERFSMYVSRNEDGSYEVKDNFYSYFFEEKYAIYLKEHITPKVEKTAKVYASISGVEGKQHDINLSVEDVIEGKINIYPIVTIYLEANGMSEEECIKSSYLIQKEIEKLDIRGVYQVYYWNLSKQDILKKDNLKDESYIYMFTLQYFNHKGERM